MIPKNKEKEGTGPGNVWCSIVGEYQDTGKKNVSGWLGNGSREWGLWDLSGGGI